MPSFADLVDQPTPHLAKFDRAARRLIKEFEQAGWRYRVSNRGHAILHAPDGVTTTSVSPNLDNSPERLRTARSDLTRWLRSMTTDTLEQPAAVDVDGFACPDCGKVFPTNKQMKMHARHHEAMTCPECGQDFGGNALGYSRHRREVHGVVSKYAVTHEWSGITTCPWCEREFRSTQALASHRSRTHKDAELPGGATTPAEAVAALHGPSEALAAPVPAPAPEPEPVAPVAEPVPAPEDALAGLDADVVLREVLAIVAPSLVGEVERLRADRDRWKAKAEAAAEREQEHEARMALLREAMNI
jgi:uncharacterized C2H2 Zn-finger protein